MHKDQERARWQLKVLADEMEGPYTKINEWEEKFLSDQLERLEKEPDYPFTDRQLSVINRIYNTRM